MYIIGIILIYSKFLSVCYIKRRRRKKKKRNQYNNRKSREQNKNDNQQIFTILPRLSLLQFIVQLAFSFTHKSDDNNKQKAQKWKK
jgi:predicted histidine transporter YuiF (NhaC family)